MLECPDIWLVSYIALQNKFCETVKELDILLSTQIQKFRSESTPGPSVDEENQILQSHSSMSLSEVYS